jgi:homoserine O-acetyltransferase/O-succinyltransferase
VWRELGHTSLEDFAVGFWEGFFLDNRDPNNLLTMLDTWWHGDVGATPGFGSTEEALASIRARAIVMPAEKDLYFPPEDEQWAVSHMTNAELRVIPGVWGHFAGGGANPVDTEFIDRAVGELLAAATPALTATGGQA